MQNAGKCRRFFIVILALFLVILAKAGIQDRRHQTRPRAPLSPKKSDAQNHFKPRPLPSQSGELFGTSAKVG
jgi:hypothetical protein